MSQTTGEKSLCQYELTIESDSESSSSPKVVSVSAPRECTVLELLKAAANEGSITLDEYIENGDMVFVKSLEGLANDSAKNLFWTYFVNGSLAKVSCDSCTITEGDRVLWKYQASPFNP